MTWKSKLGSNKRETSRKLENMQKQLVSNIVNVINEGDLDMNLLS
jgi:hypothetical protein